MKKRMIYILEIIVLLCLTSIYSFVDRQYPVYNESIPAEEFIQCDEIDESNSISQSFFVERDSLNAVSLKCSIDDSITEGELTYIIYNEEGEQIIEDKVKINTLESGKFNKFAFDEIQGCKGKKYIFEVKYEQPGRSGVCFYRTSLGDSDIKLEQNKLEIEGTLVMRTITHMFDWETFIVVNCFVLYIVLFIRMLYKFFR